VATSEARDAITEVSPVPEIAIAEDSNPRVHEDHIWPAWKRLLRLEAISEAELGERLA
jgi:hypothetical protein